MQVEPSMNGRLSARHGRRVRWKTVLVAQDWASIFASALVIIPLAITATITDAANRSFVAYDGTLSLQYFPNSTIPAWLAIVVPLLSFVISLAVLEIMAARQLNASPTSAWASTIHFIIDFICVFLVNSLLTEVTKLLVGRYRPDWLARCNPQVPATVELAYGLPASENPACNTSLSSSKITDGHKSFPSGHASTAFSLGVYCAGYVLWAAFHRATTKRSSTTPAERDTRPFMQRALAELGATAAFFWALFQLSWAW